MEAALELFEYPDTLVKKIKFLCREVNEKSETLALVEGALFKAEFAIAKATSP